MKLSPKEFILSGNITEIIIILIGIFGAAITMIGNFYAPAQVFYVAGSALLLITASYFQLLYFVTLEIILLAGHGAVLLKTGPTLQVAIPFLLTFQLLIFYVMSGGLNKVLLLIGILGIAALSIGFAFQNQLIFLFGSAAIAAYAFDMSGKTKPALIWAILNSFFAILSLYKILIS